MNNSGVKNGLVKAFGVLSICVGLLIIYVFKAHLFWWATSEYWILKYVELKFLDGSPKTLAPAQWSFSFFFPYLLAAGFFISGFGLLFAKRWARYAILITTGLFLWDLLNRFILFGPSQEGVFYIGGLFICALFIWFFNKRATKEKFPQHRFFKALSIIWIIILSLEFVSAAALWFRWGGYKVPKIKKVTYELKDESFYSQGYFRTEFPLKYTLAIPADFNLNSIRAKESDRKAYFYNGKGDGVHLLNEASAEETKAVLEKQFNYYFNFYEFEKRHYSRWNGLLALAVGGNVRIREGVEEAKVGNLNLIIVSKSGYDKTMLYWARVFNGNYPLGWVMIFKKDGGLLKEEQIYNIIASIRSKTDSQKTHQEFFNEGIEHLKKKDFESAKRAFASSIFIEPRNPKYYYYLARSHYENKNYWLAIDYLRHTLKLDESYEDARNLLKEIAEKKNIEFLKQEYLEKGEAKD